MTMIRKILERFSRGIVFKRNLPNSNRSIYVSPEGGGQKYWKFSMETIDPMLTSIIRNMIHEGDVVWDIGTNIGFFSFCAAEKVGSNGQILSIEPDTWLVNILKKSCALNKDLQIDVLPVAISDSVGVAFLNIANRSRATNFLTSGKGSSQTGGIREQQIVPTFTLDFLAEHYAKPNFIKIDVEGAEVLVLSGANNLLSNLRPIILIEIDIDNFEFIQSTFSKNNYVLYNADVFATKGLTPLTDYSFNVIAVPA